MELRKHEYVSSDHDTYLQGIKDCIPTLFGYMSVGFAFGIVGTASQLSIIEIACLSIFVYAGSAQFIICALLAAQAPVSAIILTTFIVNLRHLLLCLTLAPFFTRYSWAKNIGIGALVTDETFGVATTKAVTQHTLHARWMNGLNVTAYLCWILVTILGASIGRWISNPEALGLDYALAAMFISLLILQLHFVVPEKLKHYLKLVVYVILLMVGLNYVMPSHVAVLVSTLIAATIGVVTDK
ncbi:AzlC family ABC transporter permease [Alkalicoccobacillus porphyridii]|uniref:AzlC family ABC transporter permease n=1 Tax=Alkalicoccobacillus porphyridii TaxID=2597270 RepID=A0A553ZZ03_9BACI|nr:AzlC family ABC transporter permease [Alkalicoccobacillus porphyridii]TSB46616.1 AzlC family ABC transporter permease [Alkalicoccobacillus porphyridii]